MTRVRAELRPRRQVEVEGLNKRREEQERDGGENSR